MLGYVCKYTPVDIIESFGEKAYRINPVVSNFNKADSLLHTNMCAYSKAVLEECYNKNIDKLVLVNCCDSIRRLYDVLKKDSFFKFIHMIDLPRKLNFYSHNLFLNEISNFIDSYEKFSNKKFNANNLSKILDSKLTNCHNNVCTKNNIIVLGARCENYLLDIINKTNFSVVNLTCTGDNFNYKNININTSKNLVKNYCNTLLNQFPCMRMCDTNPRYDYIKTNKKNITGIIYHTIKFCDYYSFDYVKLKNLFDIPMLKIETDYSLQSQGQLKTRIDAFMESLKNSLNDSPNKSLRNSSLEPSNKITAGIDSGSTSTNVVILDSDKNILSYSIVKTGAKSLDGAEKALKLALHKANLSLEQLDYVISTGYGRISIPFANEKVTEITCHGKGAYFLNNNIRTIIDIGGQDSKVISLDDAGNVKDFAMNDKCAAGTGRFLENMCRVLEISINDIGKESLKWKNDLTITSMCTVFAESEVVSLIAQNKDKSDILHGLCKSISNRTLSLVNRVDKKQEIMMTGGVAKNIGVVNTLQELLNEKIYVPKEPEIVGALGAAIIALEKLLQ
ncbi:acyl-CoA dehydratase activase [Haloimpatiens sp. FM7330]|uniref:acyl-CoA dehydratase activase n=1 Tax=Haloimpatiens sp. FM7330 TaxID=3298610 RepID=UPI003632145C